MGLSRWLLITAVFVGSIGAGYFLFSSVGSLGPINAPELDWRALRDYDYIKGEAPASLKALDGQMVKMAGFMVPLEDDMRNATEFLLVPTPQACIHVPPPPPNQMILVDMQSGHETKVTSGPIWIYGTLKLVAKKHQYGESSFQMSGLQVEPYR